MILNIIENRIIGKNERGRESYQLYVTDDIYYVYYYYTDFFDTPITVDMRAEFERLARAAFERKAQEAQSTRARFEGQK